MKKEIKTFLEEFLAMWLEIWQLFGKHTIRDLRGVAHRGENINVVAGLSAQKRSTCYFLLCIVSRESEKA